MEPSVRHTSRVELHHISNRADGLPHKSVHRTNQLLPLDHIKNQ